MLENGEHQTDIGRLRPALQKFSNAQNVTTRVSNPRPASRVRSYMTGGHICKLCMYSCIHSFIHSFIHSAACLTTGPCSLPKTVLHKMRSSASYFNFQYHRVSLRSSSSWLRLLPRLLFTSLLPSIFPPVTCFRRQFLLKVLPFQLAFLVLTIRGILLSSLTLCNTSLFLTHSVQLTASILLQHHISYHKNCAKFGRLGAPFLVIYPGAVREPGHNKGSSLFP